MHWLSVVVTVPTIGYIARRFCDSRRSVQNTVSRDEEDWQKHQEQDRFVAAIRSDGTALFKRLFNVVLVGEG